MNRSSVRFQNSIAAFGVGMLLLWAASAHCQPLPETPHSGTLGDVEWMLSPLGFPCEPGAAGFEMFPCPPADTQGVMIQLRSTDTTFAAFDITITYRGRDGVERAMRKSALRNPGENPQGGGPAWSGEGFNIGRLSVPHLPDGVKVLRVRIEKLIAAGDAKEVRFENQGRLILRGRGTRASPGSVEQGEPLLTISNDCLKDGKPIPGCIKFGTRSSQEFPVRRFE